MKFDPALLAAGLLGLAALLPAQNPPAPSRVPPNASRITARLLAARACTAQERTSLPGELQHVAQLEILTSEPIDEKTPSLLEAHRQVEVFSAREIPAALVGHTLRGELELTGGPDGVRWLLKSFQTNPQP